MNKSTMTATVVEEELGVGRWGVACHRFMTENYPDEAAEIMNTERWNEFTLEVEREALDLWELLRSQYTKANPRPTGFIETMRWENTGGFYVDHEIMEQIVLQFRA